MAKNHQTIVGLDIGTTKISCIIAELNSHGEIEIIGLGHSPSRGLRKGMVVNIDNTVESIKIAVGEAENMAGLDKQVEEAYVGIAGGHIQSLNSHGVIAIKNREINHLDVERVIDAAKAVSIPMDREVIHVIPQEFIVDDQDGIKKPLGMAGVRLEAKVHIVTAAVTSAQNIVRCVTRAGLEVKDIVLEQLASSESVLSNDEKELGVALIDIGGGTSDLAIFYQGAIKHTYVMAIAGFQVSNDIAIGFRVPNVEAEKIKHLHGCAFPALISRDNEIEISSAGRRSQIKISKKILSEIIEFRMREMFEMLNKEIQDSGYKDLISSGIVLTGGTSCLRGTEELAEDVFQVPVRIGTPHGFSGLADVVNNPVYATNTGLIQYAVRYPRTDSGQDLKGRNLFDMTFGRMKEWIEKFF